MSDTEEFFMLYPKTKTPKQCADAYKKLYDSTAANGHKLDFNNLEQLFYIFDDMIDASQTFYICKDCRYLAHTKAKKYNHNPEKAIWISTIRSKEAVINIAQTCEKIKMEFSKLNAIDYESQAI